MYLYVTQICIVDTVFWSKFVVNNLLLSVWTCFNLKVEAFWKLLENHSKISRNYWEKHLNFWTCMFVYIIDIWFNWGDLDSKKHSWKYRFEDRLSSWFIFLVFVLTPRSFQFYGLLWIPIRVWRSKKGLILVGALFVILVFPLLFNRSSAELFLFQSLLTTVISWKTGTLGSKKKTTTWKF